MPSFELFSTKSNRHQFNIRVQQRVKFQVILFVSFLFTLSGKFFHKYTHTYFPKLITLCSGYPKLCNILETGSLE